MIFRTEKPRNMAGFIGISAISLLLSKKMLFVSEDAASLRGLRLT
jgi:hypothetical protein